MNPETMTVVIEPRTVGSCLDLAVLFYRQHARALLPVTLSFAALGALLSFALVTASEDGLFWSALWYIFASPLLSGLVVIGSGHAVFGAALAPWRAFFRSGRVWAFLFTALFARLVVVLAGAPCFGLTAFPVGVYLGFLPEVVLLEQLGGGRARARMTELAGGLYMSLLGRAIVLAIFALAATLTLFALVDQSLAVLFDLPLVWERVDWRNGPGDLWRLATGDPWAASVLTAVVWLVHPVVRLAWFFCYLDVRIRREGWDLELDFRAEARRLEALA